jgi:DNA polymerase III subunit epsilon
MKVLWLDLETSGLDPVKNGIIQFAALIEIDGEIKEAVDLRMDPCGKEITPEALEVQKTNLEEIKAYRPALEVRLDIKATLARHVDPYNKADKFIVGGFNVQFDIGFIEQLWKEAGDPYLRSFIGPLVVDPFRVQGFMEWAGACPIPTRRNLETLCNAWGVELGNAHNALADITATRELALRMRETIKGVKA